MEIEIKKEKVTENIPESNESSQNTGKQLSELKAGDHFVGKIRVSKGSEIKSLFMITGIAGKKYSLYDINNKQNYGTDLKSITFEKSVNIRKRSPNNNKQKENQNKLSELPKTKPIDFKYNAEDHLKKLIDCNIKNIWMVGPAGCGKTTIIKELAKAKGLPYLIISCGIGTSSTEFVGYKYPQRESTEFAKYYSEPSIILLDEFTALDPAVAQVVNSALANDILMTTTGLITRHENCIIIATSNTFGTGANRQYVSNNQLDASTIDRFVGGIIEVDYSTEYESRYDYEVVSHVNILRNIIKENELRRIASTRMIQQGTKMKMAGIVNWKDFLIVNWSKSEKELIHNYNIGILKSSDIKNITYTEN